MNWNGGGGMYGRGFGSVGGRGDGYNDGGGGGGYGPFNHGFGRGGGGYNNFRGGYNNRHSDRDYYEGERAPPPGRLSSALFCSILKLHIPIL